jgi:hypothetical protein
MLLPVLKNIVPVDLPIAIYSDSTNQDLMHRVNSFIQESIDQTVIISQHFKGGDEIRKVFDFLLNEITYQADGEEQEILKPNALISRAKGDCKSFTLFAIGVLSNLGHKCKIRFVGYTPGSNLLNHVYPIVDGVICDAVWKVYNSEKPFINKQDFILY